MTCSPVCDDDRHNGSVRVLTSTAVLADEAASDQIGPGLVAFAVVALLGVATFFLIRSMLYHLRKVPPTFDNEGDVQADNEVGTQDGRDAQRRDDGSGPGVG